MTTFRILGPVEVWRGAERLSLGGPRQTALLAVLLLHANRAVAREDLAEALWGEDEGGVKRLPVTVARLRRALAPLDGPRADPALTTVGGGYSLRVADGELDAELFAARVERSRRAIAAGDLDAGVEELRAAEALWRGPVLADVAYEAFAQAEIRRLDELRLAATETRINAELALGRHAALVGELEALVAREPTHERFAGQLMLALYRCGRQADALAVFARTRAHLSDVLALEPGQELRRLQEQILRHDEALTIAALPPLPDTLDAALATPLHGRERELSALRAAWARARDGTAVVVSVSGERGSGVTRLVAELAAELHANGVPAAQDCAPQTRPALVVMSDVSAAMIPAEAGLLTLVCGPEAHYARADVALRLGPLGPDAVRAIAAEYAPGHEVPVEQLLLESGGLPARVHERARRWAAREAGRRVDAAATRAAAGRAQLRSLEDDIAGGVEQLQALRVTAPRTASVVCPFKGLAAFDADDSEFFCGRERLVAELVTKLVGASVLGIVGPSGSGKSSVLRAGLLPALAAGVLPGSERRPQAVIRPGEPIPREAQVLAVDQFEETFTTLDDPSAFIDDLMALDCTVVLALRADQYGRCADHPQLAQALTRNHVLVPPMRPEELHQAIQLPARRAELELEPGLAQALVDDVSGEPGALPLLSSALLELWQHRDGRRLLRSAYERSGGVRAAVARLAEDAYGDLAPDERETARRIVLRLVVEPQDGTFERRRVPLPTDAGELNVIDRLADRRLLTVSEGTVEVVHEALFREWPRLRDWLEEDAEARRVRRRLADATRAWEDGGRAPDDLYRGGRLAAALEHQSDLEPAEQAFLAASTTAESRGRRRLQAVAISLALLLAVAATAGALALRQRGRALDVARTAEAERLGALGLGEPALDRALLLAAEGVAAEDSAVTRSQLLRALQRAPTALWSWRGEGALTAVDSSPDGRLIAVGNDRGRLVFVDSRTHRVSAPLTVSESPVVDVRFSPDGTRLAAATGGFVLLLDARTRDVVTEKSWPTNGEAVQSIAFSPDSRTLAVSILGLLGPPGAEEAESDILRIDARTGEHIDPLPRRFGSSVAFVGFGRDGLVGVNLDSGATTIHDPRTFAVLRRLEGGGWPAAVSPDQRILAFSGADLFGQELDRDSGAARSVYVLDLDSGTTRELGGHLGAVERVRFSRDSRLLVSAGVNGDAIVWDLVRGGAAARATAAHSGAVAAAQVTADRRTLYTAGRDGTLVQWDLSGRRELTRVVSEDTIPGSLTAAPGGSDFGAFAERPALAVFDGRTLALRRRAFDTPRGFFHDGALTRDGSAAALALETRGAVITDLRTGRERALPGTSGTGSLAFSWDGRWLGIVDFVESELQLWDRRGPLRKPTSHSRIRISSLGHPSGKLVFDPRGRWVAVVTRRRPGELQLELRALPGLEVLRRVRVPAGHAGAVSADGRTYAHGDESGRTRLYDTETLARKGPALEVREGGGPISSLSFDRAGELLVATSLNGPARLWDLTASPPTSTALAAGDQRVVAAAFIGEGTRLVTSDDGGGLRVWDLRPRALMRRACAIAGRGLTRAEWAEVLPDRAYAPYCPVSDGP